MGVPSCTVAKGFYGDSGAEAGAQGGVVGGSSRGAAPRGRPEAGPARRDQTWQEGRAQGWGRSGFFRGALGAMGLLRELL